MATKSRESFLMNPVFPARGRLSSSPTVPQVPSSKVLTAPGRNLEKRRLSTPGKSSYRQLSKKAELHNQFLSCPTRPVLFKVVPNEAKGHEEEPKPCLPFSLSSFNEPIVKHPIWSATRKNPKRDC